MSNFYIYQHRTVSPRDSRWNVFYVGKGSGRRAWSKHDRNKHWHHVVAKYGYTVDVVSVSLSEEQAFDLERSFILLYGRENLCNLTDGGEGTSNPTAEARKKISVGQKSYHFANYVARFAATLPNDFMKGRIPMIGHKIKEFRNLRDLTQSQLAERIGVTNAYISMLESGERTGVSLDVLKALARVLNTPINELLR